MASRRHPRAPALSLSRGLRWVASRKEELATRQTGLNRQHDWLGVSNVEFITIRRGGRLVIRATISVVEGASFPGALLKVRPAHSNWTALRCP
jgi:hypothetical protein